MLREHQLALSLNHCVPVKGECVVASLDVCVPTTRGGYFLLVKLKLPLIVSYLLTSKARGNLGQCISYYSMTESRNSGFRRSVSINVVEIYSIGIRRHDVRFGGIPLQLVPGSSSSRSYLCIKIRETPLLRRLRPSLKKFHIQFFSLESSGRRLETDRKEADGLVTDVLRAVEIWVVK